MSAEVLGLDFHPADRLYGLGCMSARADAHTVYIVRPMEGCAGKFELSVRHYGNEILLAGFVAKGTAINKAHKDWYGA